MSEGERVNGRRPAGGGLIRLVAVKQDELPAVAWSFSYFFFVLASYYTLRPIRDAMAVAGGVKVLKIPIKSISIQMITTTRSVKPTKKPS